MIYRTLRVYGKSDTELEVTVDGQPVHSTGSELFAFVTSVQKHGKVEVDIKTSGRVTITNVTATYPALFNNEFKGTVTFRQPIESPLVINRQAFNTLIATDRLTYDHIMFNGPTEFGVTTTADIYEGVDLDLVDLLNIDSTQIISVVPSYTYTPLPHKLRGREDLDKLLAVLYPEI